MLPDFAKENGLFPICNRFKWQLIKFPSKREKIIARMKQFLEKGINPFKKNKNYERTVAWMEHVIYVYEHEEL